MSDPGITNGEKAGHVKRFALIGAAGFIAPRHMKAIKDTGHDLVAALDRNDSVGIIDSYFPNAHFFTEFERFDRHLEKRRRAHGQRVDYVSICSPNYLHDAHIRFALRIGAGAICEKPVALNPWNVDALEQMVQETGRSVYTILQLRLHPALLALKQRIDQGPADRKHDVDLTYITPRGRWYGVSWKGSVEKSGGIATNIGVHFFDLLQWIFGPVQYNLVHLDDPARAAGFLELERARVRWFLSIDGQDLPKDRVSSGTGQGSSEEASLQTSHLKLETPQERQHRTFRSIVIDGRELEFSTGFTDLHTTSYQQILDGHGFDLKEAKPAVQIVADIRRSKTEGVKGEYHPFLRERH